VHSAAMETADNTPHLLVVDDHRDIRESLKAYLVEHGYRITLAENAEAARRVLNAGSPDLVVLDIMMPGEDGLSLCRDLRAQSNIPIILLTAVVEDTDRIIGLEMGADDYITKPFNPRELLARIKSVLRRAAALPPKQHIVTTRCFRFGGWKLDSDRQELTGADDIAISLSTGEFQLLTTFLERPGVVLSRDQLLDITRGRDATLFDRSIDNQVSRLRKKIEADPKKPVLIKTHWGGGYSFTAAVTVE
jgi:two-component system, OmpR family, response regulator